MKISLQKTSNITSLNRFLLTFMGCEEKWTNEGKKTCITIRSLSERYFTHNAAKMLDAIDLMKVIDTKEIDNQQKKCITCSSITGLTTTRVLS
ncbi:hypothetical protein CDAR_211331 [Caerostris darwini]|uniref:Uncharacterized protein n=1 Tax=Caerostris darwini TaxID=1538125 RepID=A0AAV4VY14_9ARAC|nr:hypothetical protein CDAR_211331 [Caerostris darwini]